MIQGFAIDSMNLIKRRCGGLLHLLLVVTVLSLIPCQQAWIIQHSDAVPKQQQLTTMQAKLLIDGDSTKAYPQQTPHSGRHFLPSHPAYRRHYNRWLPPFLLSKQQYRRGRFMEGWYYRLTLENASFAFIVSIEDPGHRPPSSLRLACIQVVGPNDEYLVQADRDDAKFWAWKTQQGLGCVFQYKSQGRKSTTTPVETSSATTALDLNEWRNNVESGFQILPTSLIGRINGHDGTMGGVLEGQGIPGTCEFDMTIDPVCGWGDGDDPEQKSTGGWLASFAVFEPHWQVTLADARATGTVKWNNRTTYSFTNAPFYAEKNWGAALPSKWFWTQCNSFQGHDGKQLSVTAGGGVRKLLFGQKETLGMVCVHYNGMFFEAVPWTGTMEWKVTPWGLWKLQGRCTSKLRPFEVEVVYECNPQTTPGLVFRAPTPDQGMVYFCRVTFEANVTLSLWELEWDVGVKKFVRKLGPPLIDRATSTQGGAEIGGGPWWDTWSCISDVKPVIKTLLQLPYRVQRVKRKLFRQRN